MNALLAHCTALFSEHGGLFAVFFLGGLTGSVTHCLTMCGPVVACQSACNRQCGVATRTTQWSYHLGRALTYGALGFVAALFSQQIAATTYWPYISSAMLVIAGAMFIASSLPSCHHAWFRVSAKSNFLRGTLMGFMPCGLLYAALMMTATMADPWRGMVAMWLFVLGTMPALVAASYGAEKISKKWERASSKVGRAMMAFNGLALLVMAAKVVR